MKGYYYVGLDIHKKTVSYCVKAADGKIRDQGTLGATRAQLRAWAQRLDCDWIGGMEATLFTGWVYDVLVQYAQALKVGHPLRLKAITSAKKKSDPLDATTLADLLRCDLFPQCYMAPPEIRELRRVLRYRNFLVREAVRMKNKTSGLLMEVGAQYAKKRLHGKRYFSELLGTLEETPPSVIELLRLTRSNMEVFESCQKRLLKALLMHPELRERVERLKTIPAVGDVMALTWALEIADPWRFPTIGDAISYCGLCSAHIESAGKIQRAPLSKQRNANLQTALIETAKLAPRFNPQLAREHARQCAKGADPNQASLAVVRKLMAYLLYVDKTGKDFELRQTA